MFQRTRSLLLGAAFAVAAGQAMAADITYEPPIVEAPPVYEAPPVEIAHAGGWYIRGDIDYHAPMWRGGDYFINAVPTQTLPFTSGSLRPAFSVGGGIGYQASKYFRADFTADYWFRSTFTGTTGSACGTCFDSSAMSALVLMANAYVHFGKWGRWSPYVGAGIGGAHVTWDNISNTLPDGTNISHPGASSWRFAYAAMAGTTVCLTNKLDLDVGYRYTNIASGAMFGNDGTVGPGFDRGFGVHEGRAGLRYKFGGGGRGGWGDSCGHKPAPIAYEPEPVVPIYK